MLVWWKFTKALGLMGLMIGRAGPHAHLILFERPAPIPRARSYRLGRTLFAMRLTGRLHPTMLLFVVTVCMVTPRFRGTLLMVMILFMLGIVMVAFPVSGDSVMTMPLVGPTRTAPTIRNFNFIGRVKTEWCLLASWWV